MDRGEVDRYLGESLLSFKHAESKNSARRGSLVKKTKGLELQQKMVRAKMSKEERQLRESLRQMRIEQRRTNTVRDVVARSRELKKSDKSPLVKKCPSADVDPYPVTFPTTRAASPTRAVQQGNRKSPPRSKRRPLTATLGSRQSSHLNQSPRASPNIEREEKARMQAARVRGRRVSHEFEDLNVDTKTGSLNVMNSASGHLLASRFLSRGLSRTDLGGSVSSMSSAEDLYWVGEPEAITSVRRARKTSEQQSRDSLIKKSLPDLPNI